MNTAMLENPITQDNIRTLGGYGFQIIQPASGVAKWKAAQAASRTAARSTTSLMKPLEIPLTIAGTKQSRRMMSRIAIFLFK